MHHGIGKIVGGRHFDLGFRRQVDRVSRLTVRIGALGLVADSTRVGDGHAADPEGCQGELHLVDLEGV